MRPRPGDDRKLIRIADWAGNSVSRTRTFIVAVPAPPPSTGGGTGGTGGSGTGGSGTGGSGTPGYRWPVTGGTPTPNVLTPSPTASTVSPTPGTPGTVTARSTPPSS